MINHFSFSFCAHQECHCNRGVAGAKGFECVINDKMFTGIYAQDLSTFKFNIQIFNSKDELAQFLSLPLLNRSSIISVVLNTAQDLLDAK